jgi:hypothetical protein
MYANAGHGFLTERRQDCLDVIVGFLGKNSPES